MGSVTHNAGQDYFGLENATSNVVKVVSSNENRSKQVATGPNTYGDVAKVDPDGETAAPSADYQVVGTLAHSVASPLITLGSLIAAADSGINIGGTAVPVVRGTLSINTQNGSAPTLSMSGQAVQSGAVALRYYNIPALTILPRHRAQDFFSLCTIKKGSGELTVASPITDYGLESVNGVLPIEFTLAQPKGVLVGYDLHSNLVTVDYTMNWYASGDPTIVLASSLTIGLDGNNTTTVEPSMTNPVSKACPEGYTQYTWQVSFPLIGFEVPAAA